MPLQNYRYDPTSRTAYLVGEGGEVAYTGDIADLLNGRYTLIGSTLRDTATGRIVENLGQGDIGITRWTDRNGNSTVDLTSGIGTETLNARSGRMASYNISGEVTIMDAAGNTYARDIDMASVTGYGQRLMTYVDANNVRQYEAVTVGDAQEQTLREKYAESARWATSEEYVNAAVQGYVARHYPELMATMRLTAQGLPGMEDLTGDNYPDVSLLIAAVLGTPSFSKNIRFNRQGLIGATYGA